MVIFQYILWTLCYWFTSNIYSLYTMFKEFWFTILLQIPSDKIYVFYNVEEKAHLEVVPVFISVDPDRDTVEQVREYVKGNFLLPI